MLDLNDVRRNIKWSFASYDPKDPDMWAILVDGKRVALRSGAYVWDTKRAARCALTHHKKFTISTMLCDKTCLGKYAIRMLRKMIDEQFEEFVQQHVQFVTLREYINGKEAEAKANKG